MITHTKKAHEPILAPNGTEVWGEITKAIERATKGRVKAGKIKLFHGRHEGRNKGFGKAHIEYEHADEYKSCGFDSFVSDAVTTYNKVYILPERGLVITMRMGKARLLAVLKMRGDVYSIVTVYRAMPRKPIHGEEVWEKEETSKEVSENGGNLG